MNVKLIGNVSLVMRVRDQGHQIIILKYNRILDNKIHNHVFNRRVKY